MQAKIGSANIFLNLFSIITSLYQNYIFIMQTKKRLKTARIVEFTANVRRFMLVFY
jgi:hypothetical protein